MKESMMFKEIQLFRQHVVDYWVLFPINLVILSPLLIPHFKFPVWLWAVTALTFVFLQIFPPLAIIPLVVLGTFIFVAA